MAPKRVWTPALLQEALAHWRTGLSRPQIAVKMNTTTDAVGWALRRYAGVRGIVDASPDWTEEMDKIVRDLRDERMAATLDALIAIGKKKSARAVVRRRLFLLGPYEDRRKRRRGDTDKEEPGGNYWLEARERTEDVAAAMMREARMRTEPNRQPGTRNPRFISDIAEFGAVFDRIPK